MLTVYSTQGSPGASTTAMHLAAHWASTGREVLLIEADPAGGSLSHNLGIQFTPGSASFVASGLPVLSNHLINHAQDVLFENLHVMPAPASPGGARGIFQTLADSHDALRTISENEMAVIIDGGRITADTAASKLTAGAAAVLVVCRHDSELSSLEPLKGALSAVGEHGRPDGLALAIGKSPLGAEEWLDVHGLTYCGAIEAVSDMTADLSTFLNRNKRKAKKWRISLEQAGEKLYPHAQPPPSEPSRRLGAQAPAPEPGTGSADGGAGAEAPAADHEAAPQPAPTAAYEAPDPADYGHAPPDLEPQPGHPQPLPDYGTQPDYGQWPPGYPPAPAPAPQPDYGPSHHLPTSGWSEPSQPPIAPPDPDPRDQHPPTAPQDPYAHRQPWPPPSPPGPYPPQLHEQPQTGGYPPAQYPVPAYEPTAQPGAPPHAHPASPAPPQAPPAGPDHPGLEAEPLDDEPLPAPDIKPTGSFRDWAVKLHGSKAENAAAENRGS